ncbi:histidyl-tRNA synthetase [Carbonactinospora thermoautotrophica]|uniref:Histidine--tRNA ligase n=1 Tax=Carbonactinospora thermoautotrophica TaxID=1469144 RepID=A0A132MWM6_9ACTN|nr:histidine--tRNA ligase [Carbonactinospora thermoautotrophica]KWX02269.1 Histidine--tRNA ligase [Carbonactinospora thermoautotrophica]KWX03441.1 histidyl-tRNA synthetase [Carbonactinospora thermoautotrophica]KWX06561.1 histidyl-tRNA synthetase [Carbonactinospora thermoautotrophica]
MADLLPVNPYRGTRDFLPEEMAVRQAVFSKFYKVIETYGFQRYDGPLLEPAEIYEAKSGREIADQQLYTLTDRSGRRLALRPEMTPSVARIVARFAGQLDFPLRWYSHVNCFRYERPQRGRVREHWQINCDIFGSESEVCEIEIFDLVHDLMAAVGATREQYVLRVNCRVIAESAMRHIVGVPEESLPQVFQVVDRWEKVTEEERVADLAEAGLDDKRIERLNEVLTGDGGFVDELPADELADSNIAKLLKRDERNLFKFDPLIIRAFEYYTSTVFEVFDTDPVNRRSLFGGGRYRDLAGLFTTQKIPGIGFGMGDVTVLDFLETHGLLPTPRIGSDVAVIPVKAQLNEAARTVTRSLRAAGIKTILPLVERSLSAEMKRAGRNGCRAAVIIGENEWHRRAVTVRDMRTGEQSEVPSDQVVDRVTQILQAEPGTD